MSRPPDPVAPGAPPPEAGFEELIDQILDPLYRTALRMTRHPEDAEDLVQDTVLRAFRYFPGYQRETPFKNWVLRIMTNRYIDQYHQRREREARELPDEEFNLYNQLALRSPTALPPDPARVVLSRLGEATILAAIEALPEEFRVVMYLADVEQLSYDEIAGAMSLPLGTVKSRLYRARRLVQKELWSYLKEINPE